MRTFYQNWPKVEASYFTVSASSGTPYFPVANIFNDARWLFWRSEALVTDEWILIDSGAAVSATDALIMMDTDIASKCDLTNVKLQANATDVWTSPTLEVDISFVAGGSLTEPEGKLTAFAILPTTYNLRYWRIKLPKTNAGDTIDVGKVFLGKLATLAEKPDYDGLRITRTDLSLTGKTLSGASYTDKKRFFRNFDLRFSSIGQETLGLVERQMLQSVGAHTPFFVQIDEELGFGPSNNGFNPSEFLYVKSLEENSYDITAFDDEPKWDMNWKLEEQI